MFKLLGFLSIFFIQQAFACSCAEWGNAGQMMSMADAVFLGIPVDNSVRTVDPLDSRQTLNKTQFSVIRSFKTIETKSVDLYTSTHWQAGCGAEFKKDMGLFLVFAYVDEKGNLASSSCSLGLANAKKTYGMLRELNELSSSVGIN